MTHWQRLSVNCTNSKFITPTAPSAFLILVSFVFIHIFLSVPPRTLFRSFKLRPLIIWLMTTGWNIEQYRTRFHPLEQQDLYLLREIYKLSEVFSMLPRTKICMKTAISYTFFSIHYTFKYYRRCEMKQNLSSFHFNGKILKSEDRKKIHKNSNWKGDVSGMLEIFSTFCWEIISFICCSSWNCWGMMWRMCKAPEMGFGWLSVGWHLKFGSRRLL